MWWYNIYSKIYWQLLIANQIACTCLPCIHVPIIYPWQRMRIGCNPRPWELIFFLIRMYFIVACKIVTCLTLPCSDPLTSQNNEIWLKKTNIRNSRDICIYTRSYSQNNYYKHCTMSCIIGYTRIYSMYFKWCIKISKANLAFSDGYTVCTSFNCTYIANLDNVEVINIIMLNN